MLTKTYDHTGKLCICGYLYSRVYGTLILHFVACCIRRHIKGTDSAINSILHCFRCNIYYIVHQNYILHRNYVPTAVQRVWQASFKNVLEFS